MPVINLCDRVELALLLELGGLETVSTVGVLGWHHWPVVNTIEECNCHTTCDVGLDVAMEQEWTGVDDFVAKHHPGVVLLVGNGSVLEKMLVIMFDSRMENDNDLPHRVEEG